MLKPQDNLLLIWHLVHRPGPQPTYAGIAEALGMSASEVHGGTRRLLKARLMQDEPDRRSPAPAVQAAGEYLLHGLRYAFPAVLGAPTRGLPTGLVCPEIVSDLMDSDEAWVWPDPDGETKGIALTPLYRSVPNAARRDPDLYAALALVDLLRAGRVRERKFASRELRERLMLMHSYSDD